MSYNKLFRKGNLDEYLKTKTAELKKEIDDFKPDYVLNVSKDDLCKALKKKYSISTLTLYTDKRYVYNKKEMRDGLQVVIAIPFDGNEDLFYYQPSHHFLHLFKGVILGQELHLIYKTNQTDPEKFKANCISEIEMIQTELSRVDGEVRKYNERIDGLVFTLFENRKKRVLKNKQMVEALGIPIKSREDLPETYDIDIVRKKIKVFLPKVKEESFKPEPTISSEDYEEILETINHMAYVMERNPKTFTKLSEEEIRNHILMILNSKFEGQATGETFNQNGKTDILIRIKDKNIFIAECKIWRGKQKIIEAIDQLLSYTCWRDTKTALLIFNKNKDFSLILRQIDSTIRAHPCYKRDNSLMSKTLQNETTFSYIFHQPNDKNRELILTILNFNIPLLE